jgi:SAM-dependent methyltransferase
MHNEAFEWVRRTAWSLPALRRVLEFGSLCVNGSVREVFTAATAYIGVDVQAGPGVDLAHDAATVDIQPGTWDAVLCCEVFEHTRSGPLIVANAFRHLRSGGVFIATCAGPARPAHACYGGESLDEYYRGVSQEELRQWITRARFGFAIVDGHSVEGDTYAVAVKF